MQIPQFLQGVIASLRTLPRTGYFIAVPATIFVATVAVTLATSGGDGDGPELAVNPTAAVPSSQNIDEPTTPTATATKAASTPTPTPVPAANREDCDAIEGTAYESADERAWYLGNCLNGQTATTDNTGGATAPPAGGGGTSGPPTGGGAVYAGEFALGDTLVIPSIGVNASVTGATVPSNGAMPDPAGYFNAVWYDFSNFPGLGGYLLGNLVLAAHVDCAACHNGGSGLALFYYIGSLVPGAQAQYYSHTGEVATYVVRSVNVYSPGTDWTSIVASGTADMTLITCGGTWDAAAHEYSTRTAVQLDRVS